jgi:hypothetical protein
MIPFIQRQSRVLSSRSWFAKFVCALVGCSKTSMSKFEGNLDRASQGDALLLEGIKTTKSILSSKTGTDMNFDGARIVGEHFEKMDRPSSDVEFELFDWVRNETLQLVSESTYGPDNPFWDPEVASAFWYAHTLLLSTSTSDVDTLGISRKIHSPCV